MKDSDILTMLKTDLIISTTKVDVYLNNLIEFAKAAIQEEGIVFEEIIERDGSKGLSIEDGMLVQMYAAYLHRSRRGENKDMPRSLRYGLNNKLLSQKGKT